VTRGGRDRCLVGETRSFGPDQEGLSRFTRRKKGEGKAETSLREKGEGDGVAAKKKKTNLSASGLAADRVWTSRAGKGGGVEQPQSHQKKGAIMQRRGREGRQRRSEKKGGGGGGGERERSVRGRAGCSSSPRVRRHAGGPSEKIPEGREKGRDTNVGAKSTRKRGA